MRQLVVGLAALLVVGCLPSKAPTVHAPLPSQTDLERRVAQAGLEAWREARLPMVLDAPCRLAELRIERPATAEEYHRFCEEGTAGCAIFRSLAPVAVIHPDQPHDELHESRLALHEWTHMAFRCFGRGSWPDIFGRDHADPEVFAGKHGERPDSVEQRAQRALRAKP